MTGIDRMERFMKRYWFVHVVDFAAYAKPLLMSEIITFYKCKCNPQFDRNHALHVTRECFTNGLCSHFALTLKTNHTRVHLQAKWDPYFLWTEVHSFGPQRSSNELSHPSRWSRLSWKMNSWLFKARKLWRTNTLRPRSEVSGFGLYLWALQPAKPADRYKDGDEYKTTEERPVMTSDADFVYWSV